ncbi:hypothetical protein F5Y05DRAFT_181188 [Hypoxylon sp. FL0543]|nr:hypothetical protein F5Y05DRAFT_181188 [Hypoxylon sp. FL0543]
MALSNLQRLEANQIRFENRITSDVGDIKNAVQQLVQQQQQPLPLQQSPQAYQPMQMYSPIKSVIFSQFSGFLKILGQAFDEYRIGWSSFKQENGVTSFKEDPAIKCFLMGASAHASGLNLID